MSSHSSDDGISISSADGEDVVDIESSSATGTDRSTLKKGGASSTGNNAQTEKERFVQRETRSVLLLRVVVIFVLCCAGIAISIIVYLITQSHQSENFEAHYNAAASKVTDTFLDIALDKMGAAGSLVVAMVAHGIDHIKDWPFVTLSSFQQRSATVKQSSGALFVGMNPIVYHKDRAAWENYSTYSEEADWYKPGLTYQEGLRLDPLDQRPQVETNDADLDLTAGVANRIYALVREKGVINPDEERYLPAWQMSPVTKRTVVNQNKISSSDAAVTSLEKHAVVFDEMQYAKPGMASDADPSTSEIAYLMSMANRNTTKYEGDIFTNVYFPIYSDFSVSRRTVGVMRIVIHWARYFKSVLPSDTVGILFVLENSCDEPYTYMIRGEDVVLLGHGDLHDPSFDPFVKEASFREVETIEDGTKHGLAVFHGDCPYSIRVYPSAEFRAHYYTKTPVTITFSVAIVFFFTVILFLLYDRLVERRQRLIMKKATQTHDIVASLFPRNVRDRLLGDSDDVGGGGGGKHGGGGGGMLPNSNNRLKSFLNNGKDAGGAMEQSTIADLFPNCTVFFCDLAGFTAWSSSRDPAQVFVLLQNLYKAFDTVARHRHVFKVETIGDSYVAVTGLPDPQDQHALIMCRFAYECLIKTEQVTRELETTLGPDTGELAIRIGLHSGPVTAGVLRGERSRFQLFGDTVNTAARMESTGVPGRIQASKSTVDLLIAAGKKHWVTPREDDVVAKGKGVLSTFWVVPNARKATSSSGHTDASTSNDQANVIQQVNQETVPDAEAESLMKMNRLVDWMVQILQEQIMPVVRLHNCAKKKTRQQQHEPAQECAPNMTIPNLKQGQCSLDELVEVIELPAFNPKAASERQRDKGKMVTEMDTDVKALLRTYVTIIASAYNDNPFHNFEHACHVTMNVVKFLKRIVSSEVDSEYTNGLNSDPIVVLAIVFSALVHDVDHRGISNEQLIKEEPNMASCFRHKSVAEQNSLALAFDLLMTDQFRGVREYIFETQHELARFRQVLVNVVLATDIFDKELNAQRKARWAKAFSIESSCSAENHQQRNNMRATIVMEHIMQASDVCHTMQHWHIYRKWNKRLFFELLLAKKNGRMAGDPTKFWYQGEISFFDNYVIPLAKKLEDCKVFGVSSDECINYAIMNRNEWEARGKQLVEEMIEEFNNSEWSQKTTTTTTTTSSAAAAASAAQGHFKNAPPPPPEMHPSSGQQRQQRAGERFEEEKTEISSEEMEECSL